MGYHYELVEPEGQVSFEHTPPTSNRQRSDTMAMRREKLSFPNASGQALAGLLELPGGVPTGFVLFAHCFTCGKDIVAASRIARNLASRGLATLRFDFTGLGGSDGDFANTTFSSNVADLVAAADYLRAHHQAPVILIGHSLGGAAVLAAAERVPEARAVVTIGAPASPEHVRQQFACDIDTIRREGVARVSLAGRPFNITRQFLEDIESHGLETRIRALGRALLVFHSPLDNTVAMAQAGKIFAAAKHPKSFICLDRADHLLSRREDAEYVGAVIAAWACRYLEVPEGARNDG